MLHLRRKSRTHIGISRQLTKGWATVATVRSRLPDSLMPSSTALCCSKYYSATCVPSNRSAFSIGGHSIASIPPGTRYAIPARFTMIFLPKKPISCTSVRARDVYMVLEIRIMQRSSLQEEAKTAHKERMKMVMGGKEQLVWCK